MARIPRYYQPRRRRSSDRSRTHTTNATDSCLRSPRRAELLARGRLRVRGPPVGRGRNARGPASRRGLHPAGRAGQGRTRRSSPQFGRRGRPRRRYRSGPATAGFSANRRDPAHAAAMLRLLSGAAHDVLTAVVVRRGERELSEVVSTRVHVRRPFRRGHRVVRRIGGADGEGRRLRDPGARRPVHRPHRGLVVGGGWAAGRDACTG